MMIWDRLKNERDERYDQELMRIARATENGKEREKMGSTKSTKKCSGT